MLRVPVVGGDAPLVALSVGENDAIAQRVQGKGTAQLGKEVHGGAIGPQDRCLGGRGVLV